MSKFDFFINTGISLKLLFNRFVLSSRSRLEAECRQCANLRACEATIRGETWKIGAADTSHNGSPPVVFVLRPVLLPLAHDVGQNGLFSIRQHVPLYGTLDTYLRFICGYLQCQSCSSFALLVSRIVCLTWIVQQHDKHGMVPCWSIIVDCWRIKLH